MRCRWQPQTYSHNKEPFSRGCDTKQKKMAFVILKSVICKDKLYDVTHILYDNVLENH